MAFYGCDFTFNGVKASSKGLMVYDMESYSQDDVDFSVGEIVEDRIARRYDALHYGLVQNEPLQFTLVFGIDTDDLDGEAFLTREQISEITKWLTGHQDYKTLMIDQEDMRNYKFRAMVTGLKLVSPGGLPTAFSAEITCDSPYAYKIIEPIEISHETIAKGTFWDSLGPFTDTLTIDHKDYFDGYCYPMITMRLENVSFVELINTSDNNRAMQIGTAQNPIPSGPISVTIDCGNKTVTTSTGYDLHPIVTMNDFKLVSGINNITLNTNGSGTLTISCEHAVYSDSILDTDWNSVGGYSSTLSIENQSTINGYCYPVITVNINGTSYIELINVSDGGRTMRIGTSQNPIPSGRMSITIDCKNQIITSSTGYNLYPCFNMKFLRLVPGTNHINFNTDGAGDMSIYCEFPVNIGA